MTTTRLTASAALFAVLALSLPSVSRAALPQTLNYQGRLTLVTGGAPIADSTGNTVAFKLFDALSGGTQVWAENWNGNVATKSGLFNVVLGTFNPLTIPFDQPYWLEIQVNADAAMSPRQPLTTAPYAYRAKYVDVPLSLTNPAATSTLSLFNNSGSGGGLFVQSNASGTTPAAEIVNNSANQKALRAIGGGSSGGYGVQGIGAVGVYGLNTGAGTDAMWAIATGAGSKGLVAQGETVGVSATAIANNGRGLDGIATGTNGMGVRGFATASNSYGVYGVADASGGKGIAGTSQLGDGVYGESYGTQTSGVYGYSDGVTGYGVHGYATNANGRGVYGLTDMNSGIGVYAENSAGGVALSVSGGARFYAGSTTFTSHVDFSGATITGWNVPGNFVSKSGDSMTGTLNVTATSAAIQVTTTAASSVGIFSSAMGVSSIGIYGQAANTNTIGVIGSAATGAPIPTARIGVWGYAASVGTGVSGRGLTGVAGMGNSASGLGVLADMGTGYMALKVSGPARFDFGSVTFMSHVDFSSATITGWNVPANLAGPQSLTSTTFATTIFARNTSSGAAVIARALTYTPAVIAEGAQHGLSATASAGAGGLAGYFGGFNGVSINAGGGFALRVMAASTAPAIDIVNTGGTAISASFTTNSQGVSISNYSTTGGAGAAAIIGYAHSGKAIWGNNLTGNGMGVYGQGLTGVAGIANNNNGVGVFAGNGGFAGSYALRVSGPARFELGSVTFVSHVDFSSATITGWNVPVTVVAPLSLTLASGVASPLSVSNSTGIAMVADGGSIAISATSETGTVLYAKSGGTSPALIVSGFIGISITPNGGGEAIYAVNSTPGGAATIYGRNTGGVNAIGMIIDADRAANFIGIGRGISVTAAGFSGVGGYFSSVTSVVAVGTALGLSVTSTFAGSAAILAQGKLSGISATTATVGGVAVYGGNHSGTTGTGVFGLNDSATGGTGVRGEGRGNSSVGVLATAPTTNSNKALQVQGHALFQAGSTSFTSHVDFTGANITNFPPPPVPLLLSQTAASDTLTVINNGASGRAIFAQNSGTAATAQITQFGTGPSLQLTNSYGTALVINAAGGNGINTSGSGLFNSGIFAQSVDYFGVYGVTSSPSYAGVYGSNSVGGRGVEGVIGSGAGTGIGIYGHTLSSSLSSLPSSISVLGVNEKGGVGVYSRSTATAGSSAVIAEGGGMGVSATAALSAARAFYGRVSSTSAAAEFVNDNVGSTPLKINNMSFPSTDTGFAGKFLGTDGAGNLTWTAAGAVAPLFLSASSSSAILTTYNSGSGVAISATTGIVNAAIYGRNSAASLGAGEFINDSGSGYGVHGSADLGTGVRGDSSTGTAGHFRSGNGTGIIVDGAGLGISATATGGSAIVASNSGPTTVDVKNYGSGNALYLQTFGSNTTALQVAANNTGTLAASFSGTSGGVSASANSAGTAVYGYNFSGGGIGVVGEAGKGVVGKGLNVGVSATASNPGAQAIYARASSTAATAEFINDNPNGSPLKLNTMIFPATDTGFAGKFLGTDGAGNLTWTAATITGPISITSTGASIPAIYGHNSANGTVMFLSGSAASTGTLIVKNNSTSSPASGIIGQATGVAGMRVGVIGSSDDVYPGPSSSAGIYGFSQSGYGLLGKVSNTAAAVRALNEGTGYGVHAESLGTGGKAMVAEGSAFGLSVTSATGVGIYSRVGGPSWAGYFISDDGAGSALRAENTAGGLALESVGDANFQAGQVNFNSVVDFSGATVTGWNLPAVVAAPLTLTHNAGTPAFYAMNYGNTYAVHGRSSGTAARFDTFAPSVPVALIATQNGTLTSIPGGGAGIIGQANANSAVGVYGYGNTAGSNGVQGTVPAGNTNGIGVRGNAAIAGSYGVSAENSAATGIAVALSVNAASTQGIAGHFQAVTAVVASGSALGLSVTGGAFYSSGKSVSFAGHVNFAGTVTGLNISAPQSLTSTTTAPAMFITNTAGGPGMVVRGATAAYFGSTYDSGAGTTYGVTINARNTGISGASATGLSVSASTAGDSGVITGILGMAVRGASFNNAIGVKGIGGSQNTQGGYGVEGIGDGSGSVGVVGSSVSGTGVTATGPVGMVSSGTSLGLSVTASTTTGLAIFASVSTTGINNAIFARNLGSGIAITGDAPNGLAGVAGSSQQGNGVVGISDGLAAGKAGVRGEGGLVGSQRASGLYGYASPANLNNVGTIGDYASASTISGLPSGAGVAGLNDTVNGYGVYARANSGVAVQAEASWTYPTIRATNNGGGQALKAEADSNYAVWGAGQIGTGVLGTSDNNHGIEGYTNSNSVGDKAGVFGDTGIGAFRSFGVQGRGRANNPGNAGVMGVYGDSAAGGLPFPTAGYAGAFINDYLNGQGVFISATGTGGIGMDVRGATYGISVTASLNTGRAIRAVHSATSGGPIAIEGIATGAAIGTGVYGRGGSAGYGVLGQVSGTGTAQIAGVAATNLAASTAGNPATALDIDGGIVANLSRTDSAAGVVTTAALATHVVGNANIRWSDVTITNNQLKATPQSLILLTIVNNTYADGVQLSARVKSVANGSAVVQVTAQSHNASDPGSNTVTLNYMIINRR